MLEVTKANTWKENVSLEFSMEVGLLKSVYVAVGVKLTFVPCASRSKYR